MDIKDLVEYYNQFADDNGLDLPKAKVVKTVKGKNKLLRQKMAIGGKPMKLETPAEAMYNIEVNKAKAMQKAEEKSTGWRIAGDVMTGIADKVQPGSGQFVRGYDRWAESDFKDPGALTEMINGASSMYSSYSKGTDAFNNTGAMQNGASSPNNVNYADYKDPAYFPKFNPSEGIYSAGSSYNAPTSINTGYTMPPMNNMNLNASNNMLGMYADVGGVYGGYPPPPGDGEKGYVSVGQRLPQGVKNRVGQPYTYKRTPQEIAREQNEYRGVVQKAMGVNYIDPVEFNKAFPVATTQTKYVPADSIQHLPGNWRKKYDVQDLGGGNYGIVAKDVLYSNPANMRNLYNRLVQANKGRNIRFDLPRSVSLTKDYHKANKPTYRAGSYYDPKNFD